VQSQVVLSDHPALLRTNQTVHGNGGIMSASTVMMETDIIIAT
jgi:hypothetical protein